MSSYGLKYFSEFLKRDETRCWYNIYELDFSGTEEELTSAGNPVMISQQGASVDPLNPIIGSSLTINFIAEGAKGNARQYQEFIYARNRQYKLNYYEETHVTNAQLDAWIWNNYNTFTTSNGDVTNAISTSHPGTWSAARASTVIPLNVKKGDMIIVELNATLASGVLPRIGLQNFGVAWITNTSYIIEGYNKIYLKVIEDLDGASIIIQNNVGNGQFSLSGVNAYIVPAFWQGYVLPDQYREQYIASPYAVTLKAVDQLGELKNFRYVKENIVLVTGWTNNGYSTFTSEGAKITSAQHGGLANVSANSTPRFAINNGETISVSFSIIMNPSFPDPPIIGIYDADTSAWISEIVTTEDGFNGITLGAFKGSENAYIRFQNGALASRWETTEVQVFWLDLMYAGWEQDIKIIAKCLAHTGLGLSIRENINLIDRFQQYNRLDYIQSRQELFFEEKEEGPEPWNCYDVLSAMLSIYGARILQDKGYWVLQRMDNQRTTYDIRVYDSEGTYLSTIVDYDPLLEFTAAGTSQLSEIIRPINQSGTLTGLPGWKYITFNIQNGHRNLIRNGNFEENNKSARIRRWRKKTPIFRNIKFWEPKAGLVKYYANLREEGGYSVVLWNESTGGFQYSGSSETSEHLRYVIPIDASLNETKQTRYITVELHRHYMLSGSGAVLYETHYANIHLQTVVVDPITEETGFLLRFETKVIANDAALNAGIFPAVKIYTDDGSILTMNSSSPQPEDGTAYVTWVSGVSTDTIIAQPQIGEQRMRIQNSNTWQTFELFTRNENEEVEMVYLEETISETELNEFNTLESDEIKLYFADVVKKANTDVSNFPLFLNRKRVRYTTNWRYSSLWANVGSSYGSTKQLTEWLEEHIRILRSTPIQIFRGTLIGKCDFLSTYKDNANNDKLFYTNIVQAYNPREDTWQIELLELKNTPLEIQAPPVSYEMEIPTPTVIRGSVPTPPTVTTEPHPMADPFTIVDGGGSIDIGDDQLTFSFYDVDGWDSGGLGLDMNYEIYDADYYMVGYGVIPGVEDGGASWGDTCTINRYAVGGDEFTVLLGYITP